MGVKFNKMLFIGINESSLNKNYWQRLNKLAGKRIFLPKDSPDILKQIQDTDCLLVGFGVSVSVEMMDAAPQLKYIGALATAYGKINTDYAKFKGIHVCNIPGYNTEAVAEFVFAVILEHLRELEKGKQQVRDGNYSEVGFTATEIKNKKFGVIGAGRIGRRTLEIAQGFGANICYWSRNRKKDIETKGIKYEESDSIISNCDFISLHLAQTKETENFFNEKKFMKLKRGAVVINTAPMDLVDINALEKRLKRGDITFILDHSDEMKSEDLQKISKYKNCIIYPPIAYITEEAKVAKQEIFVSNVENFLKGKSTNAV